LSVQIYHYILVLSVQKEFVTKKGVRITNGQSQAVNGRTENTMAKGTKGQIMLYETQHRKVLLQK
jgi:hypothetical protein